MNNVFADAQDRQHLAPASGNPILHHQGHPAEQSLWQATKHAGSRGDPVTLEEFYEEDEEEDEANATAAEEDDIENNIEEQNDNLEIAQILLLHWN